MTLFAGQTDFPRLEQFLPDGRTLSYCRFGKSGGVPVYYFHGSPTCRLEAVSAATAARTHGFEVFSIDRPGHGASSQFPSEYNIARWADDIAAFADVQNHPNFGVIGVSGGGPYTLACAARIPSRLSFAYDLAGWVPVYESKRLSDVLPLLDRIASVIAPRATPLVHLALGFFGFMVKRLPSQVLSCMLSASMAESEKQYLKDFAYDVKVIFTEAFAQGAQGPAQDARLQYTDWGFRICDVQYPVRFFHGLEDHVVPYEFAKYKHENTANSTLRTFQGAGHLFMLHAIPIVFQEVHQNTNM